MLTITYVHGTSAGVSGEINQGQGFSGGAYSSYILYRSLVTAPTGTGFKSASVINDSGATGVEVQWL